MKLERTTAQVKWSLSASTAHEAERTTVRCEDGHAGGRRNGVRDPNGGAAINGVRALDGATWNRSRDLMARIETERAPSMARLERDIATMARQ